jgi:hypothetical protein
MMLFGNDIRSSNMSYDLLWLHNDQIPTSLLSKPVND